METPELSEPDIDRLLAQRLRHLRLQRNWSLDDLAGLSGVSRATLSRLENGEVSPTTSVLGRLCAAHGMTMSRLMQMVEDVFTPHLRPAAQHTWRDPETGFVRRSVSPPGGGLAGEVVACRLPPDTRIAYDRPPRAGLEHHLVMLEGALRLTVGGQSHDLAPDDCLRFQLHGADSFETPPETGAHYLLFIV